MKNLKRTCILSMLLAMAIVLNMVETLIPIFIPGVKLGLANIIILIMLYEFKPTEALIVNLLRIIIVGLIRSTLLSPTFLMSLTGGIFSYLLMLLFSREKIFSPIGVSVLGAVGHTVGQIVIANILLDTTAVVYYLPLIALLSVFTGVFSGILARAYLKRSITKQFLEEQEILKK